MQHEITPKEMPTMLIKKDWTKRRCHSIIAGQQFYDTVHNLEVREDDIWLVTIPKSGTTWMLELLWLVLNDCDFERANQTTLQLRTNSIEICAFLDEAGRDPFKEFNEAVSPRLIMTHTPLPLLPKEIWTKKPKLVYVFRNPKDALISKYHYFKNFGANLNTSLEDFLKAELEFECNSDGVWNHVLEFYQLRNEPWIHYTSFEKMALNLRREIADVCKFLRKDITEEQMLGMLKHLSFEEMKSNAQCDQSDAFKVVRKRMGIDTFEDMPVVRKGKVNSFQEEVSAELTMQMDDWIDKRLKAENLTLNDLLML